VSQKLISNRVHYQRRKKKDPGANRYNWQLPILFCATNSLLYGFDDKEAP
jgi:hypothetical protein